jgi:very-short-patch-repair endonuclease
VKKRTRIHNRKSTLSYRRELRTNLTRAEKILWFSLKDSQLDGRKFRRQHGIGPYIVDFYCPECRAIVELDGAVHQGLLASERDDDRTRYLESLGMRVIRFENCEILENLERVMEAIKIFLDEA